MTSGTQCPNPAELLGTEGMSRFLQTTAAQYDMVILDTCPVLLVADTVLLASRCDGVLFVARAGKTPREAAERAVRQLLAVKGRLLGAVINELRPSGLHGYHYYSKRYGGRYGKPAPSTTGE